MRGVTTIKQALAMPSHSLAAIKRASGIKQIEALIKIHLINLNDLLNLNKPLTEAAIDEIASEVVSKYYALTMADVYLIFNRAKCGHNGQFFESINITKVMSWFSDYFRERCEVAATASLDFHSNKKEWNDRDRITLDQLEKNEFKKAHSQYVAQKAAMQTSKNGGT
jgi:hypothetical protein